MEASYRRRLLAATFVIGFGLGGFFDGILLHQVLQWHHLLSLVPGATFRDIRTQILADGLFHVLMYLVTAAGLWLLWRARAGLAGASADHRLVAGGGLLGFALWNFADIALFHWAIGLHRIRVDVPNPMAYDLAWLAVFGLVPLLIAWRLLRAGPGAGRGHGAGAAIALALLAVAGAPMAARPQPNSDTALVFFGPGASAATSLNAAMAAGTPVKWIDPKGGLMAVALGEDRSLSRLYAAGAVFVTRSPALAGCAASI